MHWAERRGDLRFILSRPETVRIPDTGPLQRVVPYASKMNVHAGGTVFLILLVFVVAFALLARRIEVPYPVMLLLGGLALSLIPGTPRVELDPDIIFYVVLPPLLFSAAWFTSWRDFSHLFVSVMSLAFGLVLFTIVGVAVAAQSLLPGFDWKIGAILGAVVAPTDAIAATAVASRLGLPRRIVDLLEGESLINDATGLVAVEIGTAVVVAGVTPHIGAALLRFVYVASIGIAIGAAVAFVVDRLERRIDDGPIEIAISLMVPYAAYLLADGVHASGVVAVVTCGLMLTRGSAEFFSPAVRLQVYAVWNAIVFILNGLVFVSIGLQLRGIISRLTMISTWQLVAAGAIVSVIVSGLRLAWMVPGSRIASAVRRHLLRHHEPPPSGRELVVVGWSGMRGVVSLAAAFALPISLADGTPFPQRDLIVFLTFSVVVFTLVVQTLTLGPLIRKLGLEDGPGVACEERDARRIAVKAALDHLEKQRSHDRPEYAAVYDDIAQHYRDRLQSTVQGGRPDARSLHYERHQSLSRELLRVERETAMRLRNDGRINDEVLRHIERELDLQAVRLR
jgi:Na+/H+ antiporter